MSAVDPELNWQRTSPVAVIFFIFNSVRRFIINGLPAVAVIVATYASGSSGRKAWMLSGLMILAVIGVLGSVLHWLRFRFCVVDDRVLLRSGVLHREELSVEFGRIQNISIREPFYMRPFGLALLSIDTAGSGQKEIILGGINRDLAVNLRETILSKAGSEPPEPQLKKGAQPDGSVLLSRTSKDIIIYGLTANFILWILVAIGAFFGTQGVAEEFFSWLASKIQFEDILAVFQTGGGPLGRVLLVIGTIFLIFLLLPLVSVLGALFRHHGYQLSVEGETYRKNSGLLTRHEESLKRHKIQTIILKQNFVARFFNRTNMQLRVASAGTGTQSGQLPTGPKATFLVPALHKGEMIDLVSEFFPTCKIDDVVFSRINRRRFYMVILGWTVLPFLLFLSGILSLTVSWIFAFFLPLGLALAWLIVSLVWKKIGYGVVGDYGFVRRGFLGTQTTVFPLFKVQRVDICQTPGQRRKGMAHLSIHLASHSLEIPYVCEQDARHFRDLALYYIESSNRPWY
ncbi:MAG: PH domain-containing protein [Gammaproteobacteria bacterium]|nr:PH domain-containing protein [Gammaproteobacteria bacterium]